MTPTSMIDAHVHLWDPERLHYAWLDKSPLDRRIDAAALRATAPADTAVVLVQADCEPFQAVAEVEWLSEQAVELPGVRGIVAYAPLHLGSTARAFLAELREYPLVVGVRRLIQDEPAGFTTEPDLRTGVALLAEFGLPFDLCVREHQLGEAIDLVRTIPEVQFVLDHLGKPQVGTDSELWRQRIADLAALPNVVCKLSGLATEVAPDQPADFGPYLRHALAEFGPDRCLFGSDWPVMTLATGYDTTGYDTTGYDTTGYDIWRHIVSGAVDPAHHDQVFRATAEQIYRAP